MTLLMTDTKQVTIGEINFTLRFIPAGVWTKMRHENRKIVSSGKNAYADLTEAEIELVRSGKPTAEILQKFDYEAVMEKESSFFELHRQVIKFGVKNHEGEAGFQAVFCPDGTVSDETIENYHLNGYFLRLVKEIWDYNSLRDQQIKN